MDPVHAHLILNHIPVVGLGAALLLLLYAIARKSDEMKKAALAGFVLLALVAIPVFLTGKAAEDPAEHLPGVFESFIEQHEEAATAALIAIEVLGAVSLAGLVLTRRSKALPKWFATILLFASLGVAGVMTWTANLGGQIRHTEIRTGASNAGAPDGEAEEDHEREKQERKKREDH